MICPRVVNEYKSQARERDVLEGIRLQGGEGDGQASQWRDQQVSTSSNRSSQREIRGNNIGKIKWREIKDCRHIGLDHAFLMTAKAVPRLNCSSNPGTTSPEGTGIQTP